MKILVIIPAYNEEDSIERVIDNLVENYKEYDYVIINDGSQDRTQEICEKRNYNYIHLPLNLGIGGGVQAGYLYASEKDYDIVVQMDGDGQHNPAYIEALIKPIVDKGSDFTIGSRFIEKRGFQTSFMRRLGIKILQLVIKLCCGYNVSDATSGFRAVSKNLIKFFCENYAHDYPEPEAIVSAILNGFKVKEVPVEMNERDGGESSINGFVSAHYMLKVSLALLFYRMGTKRIKV